MDWGRKWLVDFNAGKTKLVPFDHSNSSVLIDLEMDGVSLMKSHLLTLGAKGFVWTP